MALLAFSSPPKSMETWKRAIAFTALLGATALGVAFLLQPGRALRSTVSVSGAAPALGYGGTESGTPPSEKFNPVRQPR